MMNYLETTINYIIYIFYIVHKRAMKMKRKVQMVLSTGILYQWQVTY